MTVARRVAAERRAMTRPATSRPTAEETRHWRLGFAMGAGAGLLAGYLGRRARRMARAGLVDWAHAATIAERRLQRAPGALDQAALDAAAPAYEAAMDRIVPLLEARLGQTLPGVVERHAVVSRAAWVAANATTFRSLLARLERPFLEELERDGSPLGGFAALGNRVLATQQVGLMLGFLGSRVLGQYDIALLSAEATPGRLMFVEENIRQAAVAMRTPLEEMRLWIALHETTHAFEFEAHPWLRPYLSDRLERQLSAFLEEAQGLRLEGLRRAVRRWRRPGADLLSAFMSPEQRRLLRETQVAMSVLEGFSDWVMDEVGGAVLPDVAAMRERFEARRQAPRRGFDRFVARLTGLDLKLAQYRRGERFIAGIHALAGDAALVRLWAGPGTLPDEAELADPPAWVHRVMAPPDGPPGPAHA